MNPNSFNRTNPSIVNFTEIWKRLNSLTSLTNSNNIINQFDDAQSANLWIDGTAKIADVETYLISGKTPFGSGPDLIISPTIENYGSTYFSNIGKVGVGRPTTASRLHVYGTGTQFAISQDDTSVTPGIVNTPLATMHMRILSNASVTHTITTPAGTLPSFVYSHVVAAPSLRVNVALTPTSSADVTGTIGDIARDENFIYVKTVAGWKRSALTTF